MTVLTTLLLLGSSLGLVVYVAFLATCLFGLLRLKRSVCAESPSISVIVPMHNEAAGVLATLQALARQDYPGTWEIVCVDDRSDDNTSQIVLDFAATRPHFRLVRVDRSEPDIPSPKKRALARGMDAATGEILATTDADCLPPAHWLRTLAQSFGPGIDLVQGPKHLLGDGRACHRYQRLETLSFVAAEAAGFSLGRPFLASAPSLAYRAEIYRKSGGFHGLEGLVSGDDDMLVHRMMRAGARCTYAFEPTASVGTHPADDWSQVLNQRARWASNGSRYESNAYVALLVLIFLHWCWLLVGWIPWLADLVPGWSWWGPWMVKIPVDLVFLTVAAWKLERWKDLPDYVWTFPLQVMIAVRSAVAGHLGWFRWSREADGG